MSGTEFLLDSDDAHIVLMKTGFHANNAYEVVINERSYFLYGSRVSRRVLHELSGDPLPLRVILYTGEDHHEQFCVTKVLPLRVLAG